MSDRLGEQVGRGASSHVHAWGPGLVVKVFKPGFESLAPVEAERAKAVHEAGVESPAVHGLVDVGGLPGVVFDRIDGPPALTRSDAGAITARVHVDVHDITAPAADVACSVLAIGYRGLRDGPGAAEAHRRRARVADAYLAGDAVLRPGVVDDLPRWTSAIGRLRLEREPGTAYADELRRRWIES